MVLYVHERMVASTQEHFTLYRANDSSGRQNTLLQVPRSLPTHLCPEACTPTRDVFNIVMADVSGSMWAAWENVVKGWSESIKNILSGQTKIYAFSSAVQFKRFGTDLKQEDFDSGSTNITSALRTVRHEVNECSQRFVRVFLITKGYHSRGIPYPETEISQMSVPHGKTVDVYVLGIGSSFPVNYSIDIRSCLHNGSASIPPLFWAKGLDDIPDQLAAIGAELQVGCITLTLNHEGYILPGLGKTLSIDLGEWLFFPEPLEQLPQLTLAVNKKAPVALSPAVKQINAPLLLDEVIPQWNSILIKQHRRNRHVPREAFDLMDSLFKETIGTLKSELGQGTFLKQRLDRKNLKTYETKYATLLNLSKTIIDVEGKHANELELAESILKSTVSGRKYNTKLLRMRGHGQDDYAEDVARFQQLYEDAKEDIMNLPTPPPDHCCRIIQSSTLTDLQDPHFLQLLDNKFNLLKVFTMSGIPVYTPVRDSSQINPWTIGIKHILVEPNAVLCQIALEEYGDKVSTLGVTDKDVLLKESDEKTRFNVIIPVVPTYAATILKPLVRSNLYALLSTFCILKNPHIVDHNAHIAALGCAWVKSISDHPLSTRPQFVRERLESIATTAELYMDQHNIMKYMDALINNPKQALMTESTELFGGKTLKTESLIKPMFFLGMRKSKLTMTQTENLLRLMLAEYIGRCLSGYEIEDADATPFTDFFAAELTDPGKKRAWLQKHGQSIVTRFTSMHENLVEKFYTLEELLRGIRQFVSSQMAGLSDHLGDDITLALNMEKVKHLNNMSSCGAVRFSSFQTWAQEMLLPQQDIETATGPTQVMVDVCEALRFRSSRGRLAREPNTPEQCLEYIKKMVAKENGNSLRQSLQKKIKDVAVMRWKEGYKMLHRPLSLPLTPQQVVAQAQARGVQVTQENFSQVYRYNAQRRLLQNACQVSGCPHYLLPRINFNHHLAEERSSGGFPHSLHVVCEELRDEGVERVVEALTSGSHTGRQGRKKPTPPTRLHLEELSADIRKLIKMYKGENAMS